MLSLRTLFCLVAIGISAPSAAQLLPSPLADIYESYNDCFKVAAAGGMRPQELGPLGWSRATVASKDGEAESGGPVFYGHRSRKPLIMLTAESGEGLCVVMAKLENRGSFDEFTKAWGGKLPEPDSKGAISFSAEGQVVQLRRTGSREEPSLSIAVMTPTESK